MTDRRELIDQALRGVEAWEARWGAMPGAAALTSDVDLTALLDAYAARMDATLPFFHPRYAGRCSRRRTRSPSRRTWRR